MTEQERIKDIEERITLEGLLTGVNLDSLPPGESGSSSALCLDLYRLGHTQRLLSWAQITLRRLSQASLTAPLRYTDAMANAMALGANARLFT